MFLNLDATLECCSFRAINILLYKGLVNTHCVYHVPNIELGKCVKYIVRRILTIVINLDDVMETQVTRSYSIV